jgi:hypothetical protein
MRKLLDLLFMYGTASVVTAHLFHSWAIGLCIAVFTVSAIDYAKKDK